MPSFYPEVRSGAYFNTLYSLVIAMDTYIANALLNSETSRMVYSSTDYALLKRSGQNPWNNAALPFVNLKMDDKTLTGTRPWYNFNSYAQGIYAPELGKKIRVAPMSISFDSTYFAGRDDDYQYATDKMLLDAAGENKLEFFMEYNGSQIKNIGLIDFNFDTSPAFMERDWLEKNNIWAFSLNPTIQTFLIAESSAKFGIPKTVLLDFCIKKDLIPASDGDVIEYQDLLEFTVDHINETLVLK